MSQFQGKEACKRKAMIQAKQKIAEKVVQKQRSRKNSFNNQESKTAFPKMSEAQVIGQAILTVRDEELSKLAIEAVEKVFGASEALKISRIIFEKNQLECSSANQQSKPPEPTFSIWEENLSLVKDSILEK